MFRRVCDCMFLSYDGKAVKISGGEGLTGVKGRYYRDVILLKKTQETMPCVRI